MVYRKFSKNSYAKHTRMKRIICQLMKRKKDTYHICKNNFKLIEEVFPAAFILSSSLKYDKQKQKNKNT